MNDFCPDNLSVVLEQLQSNLQRADGDACRLTALEDGLRYGIQLGGRQNLGILDGAQLSTGQLCRRSQRCNGIGSGARILRRLGVGGVEGG